MKFYLEKDLKRFFTDKVKEFLNDGYYIEELCSSFSCTLVRGDFEVSITLRYETLSNIPYVYSEALLETIDKISGVIFKKSRIKLGFEFRSKAKKIFICDEEDLKKIIKKKLERESNISDEFITLPEKYNDIAFRILSKNKGLIRREIMYVRRKRFTNQYKIYSIGYSGLIDVYEFRITDKKE